jgi:hypothetical protein
LRAAPVFIESGAGKSMKSSFKSLLLIALFLFSTLSAAAQNDDYADPATASTLAAVGLPPGALRVREENIPPEIRRALEKVLEKDARLKPGAAEVLVWTGKNYRPANAERLRGEIETRLRGAGWDYEVNGRQDGLTLFNAIRKTPRRSVFGFWVETDDALMLAIMEIKVAGQASALADTPADAARPTRPTDSAGGGGETFDLPAAADSVNVMGGAMPKLPVFPNVAKKPNRLRGYVRDAGGKPLEGAYIGVRSSAIGGRYSAASAETDANGYYEMEVPFGAAHFYAAGYTIDYGEGRAALALHPADGKAGSFVSADGAVENFVLLAYGIADRDGMSEKPWDSSNYYGGAVRVSYDMSSGDMWASKGSLPAGAAIEITLTPEGELLGRGRKIVRRPPPDRRDQQFQHQQHSGRTLQNQRAADERESAQIEKDRLQHDAALRSAAGGSGRDGDDPLYAEQREIALGAAEPRRLGPGRRQSRTPVSRRA